MTVPSEVSRSGPYNGNGVTTIFDYKFRIVDENHVTVIKRNAAGVETTLVIDADYIVSDVGNPAGGQIATVIPPAVGETITILRNVPFVQETDLENQGAYYAETVEAAFDLMVMRDQQLSERLDRAVVIPASADASDLDELVEDILRLADSADEIDTVAGIAGDVSAVAADTANITTVANNIAGVNTVAANVTGVNTVAASDASVSTVASNIADVQSVAANMSDIQAAPQAASDAEDARDFAYAWSSAAEDVPVDDGVRSGFSAFHWAQKAAAIVTGGIAAAIHSAEAKTTPHDNDEWGYADSEDGWKLKKWTWANTKAALKTYFDGLYLSLTGGTMAASAVIQFASDIGAKIRFYGTNYGVSVESNTLNFWAGATHRFRKTTEDGVILAEIVGDATQAQHLTRKDYVDAGLAAKAGVYTGSTRDETNFPIGHQVAVVDINLDRNASATVRLHDGNTTGYRGSGAGAVLSGTWRNRGYVYAANAHLMERTA